jgi:hypothetical protein
MTLYPLPESRVANQGAEPADGVPRSGLKNPTNDEITMCPPVKLGEIVIPKQTPKDFRQLDQMRLR